MPSTSMDPQKSRLTLFLVASTLQIPRRVRGTAPINLDLAPWRLGPRHRPVQASVPWVGGWIESYALSIQALHEASARKTDAWSRIEHAVSPGYTICELNRAVLPLCQRFFPSQHRAASTPVFQTHPVREAIQNMKDSHGTAASHAAYYTARSRRPLNSDRAGQPSVPSARRRVSNVFMILFIGLLAPLVVIR